MKKIFFSIKWLRYFYLLSFSFALILILEIIPSFYESINAIYLYYSNHNILETLEINSKNELLLRKEQARLNEIINNEILKKETNSTAKIINLIDSLSYESELDLLSLKPHDFSRQGGLIVQPFEVIVSGSYDGLYNYAMLVENSRNVFFINHIKVSGNNTPDSLNINILFNAYLNL